MSVASYVSPDLKGKIGTSSRPVRRLIFKKLATCCAKPNKFKRRNCKPRHSLRVAFRLLRANALILRGRDRSHP
jgi:hypothetical protein